MKIVVDVVFNHMANAPDHPLYGQLKFPPRFGPNDFHPKARINDDDIHSVRTGWLGLPDLKTETPYVRGQCKEYLKMLRDLGADGFRFDAIKHIEPDFFDEVLQDVPDEYFSFGEYITTTSGPLWEYASVTENELDFYDFPLAKVIKGAFAAGGHLTALRDPAATGAALPRPAAVTFVRNHDTDRGRASNGKQGIDPDAWWIDENDVGLAYAFILGREDGVPYVFVDMPGATPNDDPYDLPMLLAGVRFHNLCLEGPRNPRRAERWLVAEQDAIAFQRGDDRLVGINKATQEFARDDFDTTLCDGRYVELLTGESVDVRQHKIPRLVIPARGAVFLVKLD